MNVHFVRKSSNAKIGKIPATVTESTSCPDTCPLKGSGCYAGVGPVSWNWKKVDSGERGVSWDDFLPYIEALPEGQLWRHNVAGDLPHHNGAIDVSALLKLMTANYGKHGFTFTHHDMSFESNRKAVYAANKGGFTINLSANNLHQADQLADLMIAPVVTVLPENQMTNTVTPEGRKVIICPAVTHDKVSCETCGLCAKSDRKVIIGFPAHGSQKRKADIIAKSA